jgi:hypothetical protein
VLHSSAEGVFKAHNVRLIWWKQFEDIVFD